MSKLSPDQWRALSPHLDEALEMTDEQRVDLVVLAADREPDSGIAAGNTSSGTPRAV